MNETERIAIIEQGIRQPFWTEVLQPLLAEKAKNALRLLATSKSADDDVRRGQYQAYQDVLDAPQAEIDAYKREQTIREYRAKAEEAEQYRARFGYQAPFGGPLEPGALSEEDEGATTAQEK